MLLWQARAVAGGGRAYGAHDAVGGAGELPVLVALLGLRSDVVARDKVICDAATLQRRLVARGPVHHAVAEENNSARLEHARHRLVDVDGVQAGDELLGALVAPVVQRRAEVRARDDRHRAVLLGRLVDGDPHARSLERVRDLEVACAQSSRQPLKVRGSENFAGSNRCPGGAAFRGRPSAA